MTNFSERYKDYDNVELFKILNNQKDYLPEAIEAVKNEINKRKLSDKQILDIRKEIEDIEQEKVKENKRKIQARNEILKSIDSGLSTLNPLQKSIDNSEKFIRSVLILFALLALLNWFRDFDLLIFIFKKGAASWGLDTGFFIIPFFYLPVALYLFWKRKILGWIFMTVYFIFELIGFLGLTVVRINNNTFGENVSDFHITMPHGSTYLFLSIFFGLLIWGILKKEVINKFSVNRKTVNTTLIVSILLALYYFTQLV